MSVIFSVRKVRLPIKKMPQQQRKKKIGRMVLKVEEDPRRSQKNRIIF
jgi:hypothetical protein